MRTSLGIMYRREHAPEGLPEYAQRAEAAGFDELWVVEDCFYGSGIASAAVALASTRSIRVGLGIMPAVARNSVFAAMEIATLARLYSGRFLPGLGHGMTRWMKQIGALPASQLKALEEVVVTVRRILRGERFSYAGEYVRLEEVELIHPPLEVPPLSLGVRGPKSLALSGRVADGTILAEFAAPAYVAWARAQIALGQREAGRTEPHRLTVFAWAEAAETRALAQHKLRPLLAPALYSGKVDMQLQTLGILSQLEALRAGWEPEQFEEAYPAEWIQQLAIAGAPDDWKIALQNLSDAGADTVVLVPQPEARPDALEAFARHMHMLQR